MMRRSVLMLLLIAPPASAQEVGIVLWNSGSLFDVQTVGRRADDLRRFGKRYSGAHIVILTEVTSLAVVGAARDAMGLTGYHAACSDFAQNDTDTFNSLEVGLVSKFPLEDVLEFDPSLDNTGADGEPAEQPLRHVDLPGIADVTTSRGFLTADVPALGITLVAAHLKSSRGSAGMADHANAKEREYVAAAIARFAVRKLEANPAATVLVAGDMNVGETDVAKNGFLLKVDHFDRNDGDLYDDTHAIFSAGLIDGLHMASLTKGLGAETYDVAQFAGAGPIDCLYVVGRQAGDFTLAEKSTETFGSDHFAVSTRFLFRGTAPTVVPRETSMASSIPTIRISALLPNPGGQDEGKEWVLLTNGSQKAVDLAGWKLRDKAGHGVNLAGIIAPGAELKVHLAAGQLPLNNDGDEVELLNAKGLAVHHVRYGGGQVSPGREIRFRP